MGTFRVDDGELIGSDDELRVVFDAETGSVRQVENRLTSHELLPDDDAPPWRVTVQGSSSERFGRTDFPPSYAPKEPIPEAVEIELSDDSSAAELIWETSMPDIEVSVEARFGGPGELELWPRVRIEGEALPPDSFTYPVLAEPRPLSDGGADDQLVFPAHSGWLVREPLDHDTLSAPYPDGYVGCSMQFTAYIEEDVGGFYLATHDPHSTWKELTFGAGEWSVGHDTWDLRPGTSLEYDYPIVVAALDVGDWHEPAERYREWALDEAPWSEGPDGPGDGDREGRKWLHDEVGLALWGPPSTLDWSPFYEFYEDVADTPLHVCSGWDWPADRPHTVGKEGWFPADFHPANVEAWEGHHVTPYTNDLFVSRQAEDFLERWEPNALFPYATFPFTRFSERRPDWIRGEAPDPDPAVTANTNYFMCPSTDAFRDLHAWRAATMVGDYPLDGACYDISSGNPGGWSRCWRAEHGHPPGQGREIVQAYDGLNRNSRAVTREETGEYLVQGVETMIENILGSIDFYVMRAGAGPMGVLETWLPAHEEPPGTGRELLPLFEAVYHDVGPVRHDGWLTLREGTGDLWFWLAARIVLRWGGLLSLQYANQPPERPPDYDGSVEAGFVDWGGATQHFDELPEPDPAKLSFVRELAKARTELATPYLGHGRLLRPVPVETGTVSLDFDWHMLWNYLPAVENRGNWDVPAVVQGAWEAPDGRVGVLFAAVGDDPQRVTVEADPGALWDLDLTGGAVTIGTTEGTEDAGAVSAGNTLALDLDLDPRRVTLVEIGG